MQRLPDTVALDDENKALLLLDQTLLPNTVRRIALHSQAEICEAIQSLRVRGAPAIGVAAAMGLYLGACEIEAPSFEEFYCQLKAQAAFLACARPTAVNLTWALGRMERCALENRGRQRQGLLAALRGEALKIREEDVATCRAIGKNGLPLLLKAAPKKGRLGILTHCNAGALAAVRYGTALAPIYAAQERGLPLRVFCDETRPLLQGARLTAFELTRAGVDTILLCDNMAASAMARGDINLVLVGCDRVAANGDTANKIGTLGVAVLARHYGIPFYVCAPSSTLDFGTKSGAGIVIERRAPREVTEMWYRTPMAPQGVKVRNPAFDVTDNTLITAFITEYGVARPPFARSLGRLAAHRRRAPGQRGFRKLTLQNGDGRDTY